MTPSIPPDAIDDAADAMSNIHDMDVPWEAYARAALDATAPAIRAQERERIARLIEAAAMRYDDAAGGAAVTARLCLDNPETSDHHGRYQLRAAVAYSNAFAIRGISIQPKGGDDE